MLRRIACTVLGLCLSAACSLAQSGWSPQEGIENLPRGDGVLQQTAALGWNFQPITNEAEVTAFFATLEGADAFGGNVKLMYFSLGSDGNWTSFGWQVGDIDAAVTWIRTKHGATALERSNAYADYPVSSGGIAPEQMKNGFFITDPNADLVAAMGPDLAETTIAWLAEVGYPVAPKLSEKLSPGGQGVLNDLMGFLANQAEYTLFPLKTTYANVKAMAWCSCTTATTSTPLATPGPATLVPSTPTSPNPVRALGGECTWKYQRDIKTVTTTSTGKTNTIILCPSGASTSTKTTKEYTTVTGPCTAPVPVPQPGDYWWER